MHMELSRRRANAVAKMQARNHGGPSACGSQVPVASNDSRRPRNNRPLK